MPSLPLTTICKWENVAAAEVEPVGEAIQPDQLLTIPVIIDPVIATSNYEHSPVRLTSAGLGRECSWELHLAAERPPLGLGI
ncbi:MAG: hypothetical protein QXK88_08200 [Desulfurococcaceae archaeon]